MELIKTRVIEGSLEYNNYTFDYTNPDNEECKVSIKVNNKVATVNENGCEVDVKFSGKYKFSKKSDTGDQFMKKATGGK